MLVEITKNSLINAVQNVVKAIAVNSPIPILTGIHIQACAESISFTASNTSMTIESIIPQDGVSVTIKRTGAIVIPSRYFYDVIRKLDDGKVVLEIKGQLDLTVKSGYSQIRLCGMDSKEFPSTNNREQHQPNILRINSELFKATIKQVAIVASTSENRPVLTGVSLSCNNESLTLIATDGVRLASRTLNIENNKNLSFNAIIPAKNLYEVSKMLSNENETTEIEVSNNRVKFLANGLKVETALIEGTFPSVTNIIPQSYLCEILVDKARLLSAVECGAVLASENIIKLLVGADKLKLLSRTAEIGDVENEVPLIEMRGDEFIISLNGKFLLDILRNSDSACVRIRFSGKTSPVVVIPNESLMTTLFLITPVRTHH